MAPFYFLLMVLLLYKFYRMYKITFKILFVHAIFFIFVMFINFRNGLLQVNSGKTLHSRESLESHTTSRTFEFQSARPHIVEVYE